MPAGRFVLEVSAVNRSSLCWIKADAIRERFRVFSVWMCGAKRCCSLMSSKAFLKFRKTTFILDALEAISTGLFCLLVSFGRLNDLIVASGLSQQPFDKIRAFSSVVTLWFVSFHVNETSGVCFKRTAISKLSKIRVIPSIECGLCHCQSKCHNMTDTLSNKSVAFRDPKEMHNNV